MKTRHILLTCLIIVLGALYGRFHYKRDHGYYKKETSFFEYLAGKAAPPEAEKQSGPETGAPGKNPDQPDGTKHPAQTPEQNRPQQQKTSTQKNEGTDKNTRKLSQQQLEALTARAKESLRSGRYDQCAEMLKDVDHPQARELRYNALLLKQMISDVSVDPGARADTIYKILLSNKNTLYAVDANKIGGTWHFKLVTGINCSGLEVDNVQEINPDTFRSKRHQEVQKQLSSVPDDDSFQLWRGIRLAWRRGFPGEVYTLFAKLQSSEKQLRALTLLLPDAPETPQTDIAQADAPQGQQTAPSVSPPGESVVSIQPAPTGPEKGPAVTVPSPGVSTTGFAAIDEKIRSAQGNIYKALQMEGPKAEALLKEAGKMLIAARRELKSDTSLPRNEEYRKRLHKVNIILVDFLKMSGFGL